MWRDIHIRNDSRVDLGISLLDYAILDIVFKSQRSSRYSEDGYCKTGCRRMGRSLGFTKDQVHRRIKKLEEKKLIEINEKGHKKVTEKFTSLLEMDEDEVGKKSKILKVKK